MDIWKVGSSLLFKHGVYVRECNVKIGLDGNYLSLACRNFQENQVIF